MATELLQLHFLRTIPERSLEDGVFVFDHHAVDFISPVISIDSKDEVGIGLFREFCAKLYDHYRANPNLVQW